MLIGMCDELPDGLIQSTITQDLVEEKRKQTGEEDNTSKRHNTTNAGKEGQAQPTPRKEIGETIMKTGGSSQPSPYKLRSDIEQRTETIMSTLL